MAKDENNTITLGQFGDDLAAHARRCWALSAAIAGLGHSLACEEDPMFTGVDQMVHDILLEAKRLSDALLTKAEA